MALSSPLEASGNDIGIEVDGDRGQVQQCNSHDNASIGIAALGDHCLITMNFATVNYLLDVPDLERTLRAAAVALRSGGALIFDFIPAASRGESAQRELRHLHVARTRSTWPQDVPV